MFPDSLLHTGPLIRISQVPYLKHREAPQLLSFFPSGAGEKKGSVVTVEDPDIILSSVKKKGDGYELTLFNASGEEKDAEVVLHVKQEVLKLHFGKYELKMVEIF